MMKKSVGIIGYGNMGQAIAEGIKLEYRVGVFDKDKEKLAHIRGLKPAASVSGLAKGYTAIILAVKPQDFDGLLAELGDCAGKLLISIAAGITTSHIENRLGAQRIIRAMPNMPARIGKGVTCLCKGKYAGEEDLVFAKDIFKHIGEVLEIDEALMNAATAVSGNGPAYVCHYLRAHNLDSSIGVAESKTFLEEFIKAAQGAGFAEKEARLLVRATFAGTLSFLKETGISPAELMAKVASKGGTTEAALKALNSGGSLADAVKAGLARAEELSERR